MARAFLLGTMYFAILSVSPALVYADEGGVLSRASPGTTLRAGSIASESYPARALQLVAPGAVLELPAGAQVVVVCANDRAVELGGPTKWQLGSGSCDAGISLPAGTYSSLVPRQGRGLTFHGSLLMEAPSRSDDENGKLPVLVRPRSPQRGVTEIADPSPTLVWTAVNRAERYELFAERRGRRDVANADLVRCRPEQLTEPLEACSLPWPWAPLAPGEEVELWIVAHTPDPDRPLRKTDSSHLRLLDTKARALLGARLSELVESGLSSPSHLLMARIYADSDLFNEAAEALEHALAEQPSASLTIRLADLYLGLGQQRAASNLYGRAERLLPSNGATEVRAALLLGLGRSNMRRNEADLAARNLEKAARLFEQSGMPAAAEEARQEAELARRMP